MANMDDKTKTLDIIPTDYSDIEKINKEAKNRAADLKLQQMLAERAEEAEARAKLPEEINAKKIPQRPQWLMDELEAQKQIDYLKQKYPGYKSYAEMPQIPGGVPEANVWSQPEVTKNIDIDALARAKALDKIKENLTKERFSQGLKSAARKTIGGAMTAYDLANQDYSNLPISALEAIPALPLKATPVLEMFRSTPTVSEEEEMKELDRLKREQFPNLRNKINPK